VPCPSSSSDCKKNSILQCHVCSIRGYSNKLCGSPLSSTRYVRRVRTLAGSMMCPVPPPAARRRTYLARYRPYPGSTVVLYLIVLSFSSLRPLAACLLLCPSPFRRPPADALIALLPLLLPASGKVVLFYGILEIEIL
jgi:hypothetical protein